MKRLRRVRRRRKNCGPRPKPSPRCGAWASAELARDPATRWVQRLLAAALSGSKARQEIPSLFADLASGSGATPEVLSELYREVRSGAGDDPRKAGPAAADRSTAYCSRRSWSIDHGRNGYHVQVSGEQLNDFTWHVEVDGQGRARLAAARVGTGRLRRRRREREPHGLGGRSPQAR